MVGCGHRELSFYMDSDVDYPGRIRLLKGNKSISLSFYNTAVVYYPRLSKMDIYVSDEETVRRQYHHNPLSFYFYMDSTIFIPRLRIKYIPLSSIKSSKSKVSFLCFGSQSSPSKSSVAAAKVVFGSFGSQSYESKVIKSSKSKVSSLCFGSQSSQSKSVAAKVVFGSFGSQSYEKVSFLCFGSQSSQSMAAAKVVFGSQSSESKVIKSSKSKVSRTNYIPEEIAFSILSKLSIKSLKRFGCVSKSWSILFENTHFMNMYGKHFISSHASNNDDYHTFILTNHFVNDHLYHSEFFLLENTLKLNLPSPLQPSRHKTCILGSTSVNGIFCIGQISSCCQQKSIYVLWNPLTEEFNKVPLSPAHLAPILPASIDPEDDMYRGTVFHGFGYDQLTDDFKVFQFVSFGLVHAPRSYDLPLPTGFFEIYSLKNNSWRMIHMDKELRNCDFITHSKSFNGLEVYVDGACHWLVSSFNDEYDNLHALTLLSFDLSDEVFITTPIGEETISSPYYSHHHLTVLNRSIALIANYHEDIDFHISILGELGVSESWIKLYIYGPFSSIYWPPIGFGKMGYIFVGKKDYQVAYVDLSTQTIEEVGIINGGYRSRFIVGLYKESLRRIK